MHEKLQAANRPKSEQVFGVPGSPLDDDDYDDKVLPMTRNLVLLFAAIFIALTALDLATTWVGVFHMGYVETNPYTDLSSVAGLVIPEIITLFIGIGMVVLGAELKKTELSTISQKGPATFRKIMLSWRQYTFFLICGPMLIAVLRSVPVFSNALLILTGYGLFVDEEFAILSRNTIILVVCAFMFMRPTVYLIYRVCLASTR